MYCFTLVTFGFLGNLVLDKAEVLVWPLEYFISPEIASLLLGFAPLLGVAILIGLLVHLYLLFICSVDQKFSEEANASHREPHKKSHPHICPADPLTFITSYISQTEHSPPSILFS